MTDKICSCEDCRSACKNKPGWFKPGQAEKVAKHLGISLQELFETRLGVDWWEATWSDDDIFVLAPATTIMEAGSEYPGDPYGRCVFYRDGRCEIYPVRPYECAEYMHSDTKSDTDDRHKSVAEAWENEQAQITELLGREPVSEVFNSFLSWFL